MSHHAHGPGEGNLHVISRFADLQRSRGESFDTVRHELMALVNSLGERGWASDAAHAWKARVRSEYDSVEAASELARAWAAAADSYHSSVERIRARAQQASEEIWAASQVLNGLSHVAPEYITPATRAQIQQYEDQRASGYADLNALAIEREQVDAAFAAALRRRSCPGEATNWTALSDLYAGATTATDIADAREGLLADNLDRAHRIINVGALDSEIEDLTAFLAAASNDPDLASRFWLGMGGGGALDLLDAGVRRLTDPQGSGFVDPNAADVGVDFGRAIRDSLSAGSRRWTDDVARDFSARMLTGQDWPGDSGVRRGNLAGVGFLFDDAEHHPMGEALTTATADIFDSWERSESALGEVTGSTRLESTLSNSAISALTLADQIDRCEDYGANGGQTYGAQVLDPVSRVLDTLGTYPHAAWEWLSADASTLSDGSPAMAADKVGYWASRDWTADGWDGFGSLWAGSMRAEGGLVSDASSQQTWDSQCDIASRIITGLDAGGHLIVGSLSAAGGTNLGEAVGHLMPFAEFHGWSTQNSPPEGFPRIVAPDDHDPTLIMPYIPLNDFGDIVASIVSNPEGFAAIRTSVTQVENALVLHADEVATYEAWDDALSRYATLEASFEGAVGGAEIMQARLDDAAIRQRMAVVGLATSFIPGSGLPGAVGNVSNFAIGQGADGAQSILTDALATNEAEQRALLPLTEQAGAAGLNSRIHALNADPALTLGDVEPGDKSKGTWFGTFTADHGLGFYHSTWGTTDDV